MAARGEASFLIVDDEPLVARALARVARGYGEVYVAGTVAGAMELLTSHPRWTALFVDIGLPDGSGLDVIEAARALHPRVPALVLTGYAVPEMINRAHDLGAGYLCKPFDRVRLATFIESCAPATSANAQRSAVVTKWRAEFGLTKKESAVFEAFLSDADATRESVARALSIGAATLQTHLHNIFQKSGYATLGEVLQRALREVHK